jgi:hypothetical protein
VANAGPQAAKSRRLASPCQRASAARSGAAKVSRQSLHRWLKEPAFRKALKQARHLAVRQASAYVQGLSGDAAATLMDVIRNKEASVASRVSASRIALEMTYQLLEADEIAERLERLERLKRGEGDGQEPGW